MYKKKHKICLSNQHTIFILNNSRGNNRPIAYCIIHIMNSFMHTSYDYAVAGINVTLWYRRTVSFQLSTSRSMHNILACDRHWTIEHWKSERDVCAFVDGALCHSTPYRRLACAFDTRRSVLGWRVCLSLLTHTPHTHKTHRNERHMLCMHVCCVCSCHFPQFN